MASYTPIAHTSSIQAYTYWDPPNPVSFAGQNSTEPWVFNPTTFTLITTPNEAVLVDTPILKSRAEPVAAWIAEIIEHRTLSTIYITHGHGDHFFAAGTIQEKFPDAVIRATNGTYHHMLDQVAPALWDGLWVPTFPELAEAGPPDLHVEVLPEGAEHFTLDGHKFQAVEVAGGDIESSTVLHVPDLSLVVGGDVIYGTIFQYLAENTTPQLRQHWIEALDQIAALRPKVVVPSHRKFTDNFGVDHLSSTQEYIRTWSKADAETKTWQDFEEAITRAYPERYGNFILRFSELVTKASYIQSKLYTMSAAHNVSSKEAFASAIEAVFTCPESELESKILNIYTKDAVIIVNQKRMTWNDFFPYMRGFNNSLASIQIKPHHLLRDGNMFAEKHTAYAVSKDGTKSQAEAICLFEVNEEKKVIWLEEFLQFCE
ncbi:Metallo-hydrolase/oxidoreductase [Trichoderma austrokoningii]